MAVIKEIKSANTVGVDPRKEYIAGGVLNGLAGGARVLAHEVDDLMREVSPKVYDQMMSDPEISKCINILKISVLGDGVELLPAVPENDENFETAALINDFCTSALRGLNKPLRDSLEQMMDALIYGHKIAELTYKTDTVIGFDGLKLIPDKIKVKDRTALNFVVDNKLNVLGFIGRIALNDGLPDNIIPIDGLASPVLKLGISNGVPAINGKPILPREKFMVLTIRSKDEDPRGQSLLRPAFNAWQLKTQIWPEYLRYLLLCAIPLLVATTPENETSKELKTNPDGTIFKDELGRVYEVSSVKALSDALVQARNATTLALPGGSVIKEIGAQGSGVAFHKAVELYDRQMEAGILLQTLATSEGIHQSRAASQTHMSVLDLLVWWLKGVVIDMLVSDLLKPMVRYNFGDGALEFTPRVSLGDVERRDFSTDSIAIAALYKAGYLQADQMKQTDSMLGLPIRESVDPLLLVQQLQNAGVAIEAVPPPPEQQAIIQAGPGGGSKPVPVTSSNSSVGTGSRTDSAQQLASKERKGGSKSVIKFPALGRKRPTVNKGTKNSENKPTVNKKP